MIAAVQRLPPEQRPALLAHLLSLPPSDRQLRFGMASAPSVIADYVAKLDFARDTLLGVHDDDLSLAALAHVAFAGAEAEIGLSVLPRHRRRGLGAALLERAVEHARNRGAGALLMDFLSINAPVVRLAQRLGMRIFAAGIESRARLELARPSAASRLAELAGDALAASRGACKAFVAGWNHRLAARTLDTRAAAIRS
jgi:GNAT superfamily N-acetyltransferase